jgi:protein TonB
MFANFATAIPSAAAITLMLLFAMQSLIVMRPMLDAGSTPPPAITFMPGIPPEPIPKEEFEPVDRPEVVPAPRIKLPVKSTNSTSGGTFVQSGPVIPKPSRGKLDNPFTNDGPLIALVRVQPNYPAIAATRALEGIVVVQFDVLADGTVTNVSVLSSSNSIFERSAVQAASRFRFKARVADGIPQTSTGVQYQFRFEMDK